MPWAEAFRRRRVHRPTRAVIAMHAEVPTLLVLSSSTAVEICVTWKHQRAVSAPNGV